MVGSTVRERVPCMKSSHTHSFLFTDIHMSTRHNLWALCRYLTSFPHPCFRQGRRYRLPSASSIIHHDRDLYLRPVRHTHLYLLFILCRTVVYPVLRRSHRALWLQSCTVSAAPHHRVNSYRRNPLLPSRLSAIPMSSAARGIASRATL